MMMNYYDETLSNVPTSSLNDRVQAKVLDIYMPPKVQLMVKNKDNGSFTKTDTPITKYSDVFLNDGKYNRNMFIQGEAGSGKSTFLASLVMDWCRIKTAKPIELLQKDETNTAESEARRRSAYFFNDLTILEEYSFVFHVTLRDSVNEIRILEIIKRQMIDSIYSDHEKRQKAYKLLNEIMEREHCLVLQDGLDEWTGNKGLPVLDVCHSQCDVLITTRPWKMTEAKIPDQKINTLLQLDGVNEPFEVSKRLLGCRDDCKDRKALDKTQSEFESYILKNDLSQFLISPMLLQLIVQSWVEGTEMNCSQCEIYSIFLESLLKKSNKTIGEFQQPPFRCFKNTQYIQPNIENVDRLAEAAFYLLFSNTKENSLVFSLVDLKQFKLDEGERMEFALKSGILSATRKASALRSSSSFSFIHKSIQDFLAAYYIAQNTHLIDDIISAYLNRYEHAHMAISQVFIFLCGLKVSAANKLSGMMNERDVVHDSRHREFSKVILSGYREAEANKHSDCNLKLSHFVFLIPASEIRDLHNIWMKNSANVLSLCLYTDVKKRQSSPERGRTASHYEFDLSTCSKLNILQLFGFGIFLKDSSRLAISELPVWIVLNSADSLPVLSCIERISLGAVTCSSTCLRSLFSTLVTLDHEVQCLLEHCTITSCVEGSDTATHVYTTVKNYTLEMNVKKDSPGLWEALHSLNIKSFSINGGYKSALVNHGESLSQSLSSLTQLETLTLHLHTCIDIQPRQSLKRLNIYCKTLLPSKLRELVDPLRVCNQKMESRLEFGCAECTYDDNDCHEKRIHKIAPEEYIPIKHEIETLKHVAVKRFRIFDRIREATRLEFNEDSCWSVRSYGVVDNDIEDDDYVDDVPNKTLFSYLDNEIINRISMRLLIQPQNYEASTHVEASHD